MTTIKDYFDFDFLLGNFPRKRLNITTVMRHLTFFCEDSVQDKVSFGILLGERIRDVQRMHDLIEEQRKWEAIDA